MSSQLIYYYWQKNHKIMLMKLMKQKMIMKKMNKEKNEQSSTLSL